jgi:hypothetical protein
MVRIKLTESADARNARLAKEQLRTPEYTVHWTSALSGTPRSSSCINKPQALREARELFVEGARNISVSKFSNGTATDINWRKS